MKATIEPITAAAAMLRPARFHEGRPAVQQHGRRWTRFIDELRLAVASAAQRRLLALGRPQRWGTLTRVGMEAALGIAPSQENGRKLGQLALESLIGDRDVLEVAGDSSEQTGRWIAPLPMVAVRSSRRDDEFLLAGISPLEQRRASRRGAVYARYHRRWLQTSTVPDGLLVVDGDTWVARPSIHTPARVRRVLQGLMEHALPTGAQADDREFLQAEVPPGKYSESWTDALEELGQGLWVARVPKQWGGAEWRLVELGPKGELRRALDLATERVAAALPGTSTHERAWLAHLACHDSPSRRGARATLIRHRTARQYVQLKLGVAAPAWLGRQLDLLGYRESHRPWSWLLQEPKLEAVRSILTPWYRLTSNT